MKIAFVVDGIILGGTNAFLMTLGAEFIRLGHTVDFVCAMTKGEWWDAATGKGFGMHCLELKDSNSMIPHVMRVGRFLRSNEYDVVFVNNTIPGTRALNYIDDSKAVVSIIHGDRPRAYEKALNNPTTINVAVAISKRVLETGKARLSYPPIVEISHGVTPPSEDEFNRREAFELPLRLIYVGRLSHQDKGILLIPEMLKTCVSRGLNIQATIVGEGKADEKKFREKIQEYKLGNIVHMTGRVERDRIFPLFLKHHIALVPSFTEAFGLAALEAQACGCIPIASRITDVMEFTVSEGQTGFLAEAGDVDGFVDWIETLHNDPPRIDKMSIAGREYVMRNFTFESTAGKYLALFQDVLDGKYPLRRTRKRLFGVKLSLFSSRDLFPKSWRNFPKSLFKK